MCDEDILKNQEFTKQEDLYTTSKYELGFEFRGEEFYINVSQQKHLKFYRNWVLSKTLD